MVSRSALVRPSMRLAIASPVEASRSLSSVPLTEIASKMRSPVRDRRSASSPPRMVIVSAIRVPVSSSLSLISWPRSARSTSSESELVLSASLTSRTWVEIVSAARLPVSEIERVISSVRRSKLSTSSAPTEASVSFTSRPRSAMVSAIARPVVSSVSLMSALREQERVGHFGAGRGQRLGDVAHRVGEAGDEILAAARELLDHVLAGAGEGGGDLVAAVGERHGDAVAGMGDVLGDRLAREPEVLRQRFLGADDRGADALGVDDDRLALAGEVVDQRAHARLVVGIGALERRHFVVDEQFEFARPGDGALDAVADRRDLAADGLADIHHRVGGDVLRLREPRGEVADRARRRSASPASARPWWRSPRRSRSAGTGGGRS